MLMWLLNLGFAASATEEPEPEDITSFFVLPVTARPIRSAVTARSIGATSI